MLTVQSYNKYFIFIISYVILIIESSIELLIGKVGKNIEVALGPERYSYVDLLNMIKKELKLKTVIIPMPNRLAWLGAQILGYFLNDVMLTWPEVLGLRQETLWEDQEPTGKVHLREWVKKHKDTLGNEYHNELDRRSKKG